MACTPSIKRLAGQHSDQSRSCMSLEELDDTNDVTMADIYCMFYLSQFSFYDSTISYIFIEQRGFRPEIRGLP
jgi:hypothetical protein